MAAAGKAYVSRTKGLSPPAQTKDGGYGPPPHPIRLRIGMKFWPRVGKRKRPFVLRAIRDTHALGTRIDGEGETVRVTVARLLATRPDGQGAHYQFLGFPRRRYRTFATVHSVDGDYAILALPEWHPRRPVRFPLRLLPAESRQPGTWLRCVADLGAPVAAHLNLADPIRVPDPGADVCHRPALALPTAAPERTRRPAAGVGCGDIVLTRSPGLEALARRGGLVDVYVGERPAGMSPGDRVYLSLDGGRQITGYLVLERAEIRPMGVLLRCRPDAVPLDEPIELAGELQHNDWRWRWWPRNHEHHNPKESPCPNPPSRCGSATWPTSTESLPARAPAPSKSSGPTRPAPQSPCLAP